MSKGSKGADQAVSDVAALSINDSPILSVSRRPALAGGPGLSTNDLLRTTSPRPRSVVRSQRIARWQRVYGARVVLGDALAASVAAAAAYSLRFGDLGLPDADRFAGSPIWMALSLPFLWLFCMLLCRTYEARFLGVGSEEFQRVLVASTSLVAIVGTTSWALKLEIARGFVVVALPLATVLTLLSRYLLRRWLHRRRAAGQCLQTVVAVGHRGAVAALVRQMRRASYHGMTVTAACVPGGESDDELRELGVPVLGSLQDVVSVTQRVNAHTVAVLSCPELDGSALRRLGWELESTRADLVVAPAITEVIGPRVAIRPICGLPLLHLERPELRGVRRIGKSVVDRTLAAGVLFVMLPVLLVTALFIVADSRGSVLFRQERIGRDGRPFTMLKFRSMVPGAQNRLIELSDADEGNGILFKMRADPRVTRVGRWMRRYSIDEVPQLINVLRGDMSLVGPRPPLASEVALYENDVRRRLLVKPGLTGLWQINGRSDLDWDESVRLDLRYVENWSFAFDFMILWKTLGAVVRGRGAY